MDSSWRNNGPYDDDSGDDGYDDDYQPESYLDPSAVYVACPHCGADVHEESLRCAVCGQWMPQPPSVFTGRPWWWVVLGVLGILATLLTLAMAQAAPHVPPRADAAYFGGGMLNESAFRHQSNWPLCC